MRSVGIFGSPSSMTSWLLFKAFLTAGKPSTKTLRHFFHCSKRILLFQATLTIYSLYVPFRTDGYPCSLRPMNSQTCLPWVLEVLWSLWSLVLGSRELYRRGRPSYWPDEEIFLTGPGFRVEEKTERCEAMRALRALRNGVGGLRQKYYGQGAGKVRGPLLIANTWQVDDWEVSGTGQKTQCCVPFDWDV